MGTHVTVYAAVNLLLVAIWWISGGGSFWPVIPTVGLGIGLAINTWKVLSPKPGPAVVNAEMDRLRARQG